MNDPVIKVENLKVIYNEGKSNETRALDDINFQIFPREYIIIHGHSGCGKSTLLYSISGLQTPSYGTVKVKNVEINKMDSQGKSFFRRHEIGLIFQAFHLVPSLTVLDNVCLPLVFAGETLKKRKEKGIELLRRFGIVEQKDKFPAQLSGGQKQRVAIARALIGDPEIILADEPVGNLDSDSARNVLNILKELNEIDKKTIILVTHNKDHLFFADRIIHMSDGKVTDFEVNKEKRPSEAIRDDVWRQIKDIPSELRLLARTFKNITYKQTNTLLTPFKAKQLLMHIVSHFTEEQLDLAEGLLRDFLFGNIDLNSLQKTLDLEIKKGGAGWNKQLARSFSARVQEIMNQVRLLTETDINFSLDALLEYLLNFVKIKLDAKRKDRLKMFLKLRLENKTDAVGLSWRLDTPYYLGGAGLNKRSAEKISKEVELIMLLKYSYSDVEQEKTRVQNTSGSGLESFANNVPSEKMFQ